MRSSDRFASRGSDPVETTDMSMTGGITRIVTDRGFAFVRSGENDYFLHHTELTNCQFNKLQIGDQIRFEPAETAKGLRATNAVKV